jgi:hypothetical protein
MNYAEAVKKLQIETRVDSSFFAMRSRPAYRQLLAEGRAAMSALIQSLRDEPSMAAIKLLEDITGERPYQPEHKGSQRAAAWIKWAESNQ